MNQKMKSLEVDNLKNLAERQYEHIEPLVENLLPGKGVYLFCGASKIGKSYLAFDLGLHICSGKKFWNYDVNQTDVLYLCLEDDDESLQERMFSIAEEYSENFYFATGETFQPEHYIEQLDEQMQKHPNIGLIILDTLAAVRGTLTSTGNAYQDDYNSMNKLHRFALKYSITILVIHHVRKLRSVDPFDDISGTNGLFGAADGAMIIRTEKFGDDTVKFYTRIRRMIPRVLTLEFETEELKWKLVEENAARDDRLKSDPDLRKAVAYINEHGGYDGSASEFCRLIEASKKPQSVCGKLFNRSRQLEKMGIYLERTRRNTGVFLHITVASNIPSDMVMPPPLVIDFPPESMENDAVLDQICASESESKASEEGLGSDSDEEDGLPDIGAEEVEDAPKQAA